MNKKEVLTIISIISIIIAGFYFSSKNNNSNKNQLFQYYFAYGSNMNTAQMKERCGVGFKGVGSAQLNNYEFGFDKRGYANIRPKQGESVWGFVWEIDAACIDILDGYEGYPNVYNRKNILVRIKGQDTNAFAYIEPEGEFGGTPQSDYLNSRIIPGAKENELPQEWITKLEQYNNL